MSRLIDLEELIHDVKNKSLLPNLREAISCYQASSYRACIILSFNSLVDDLIEKLKHLKDVNGEAKRIYLYIGDLIEKQAPYENTLIEMLVKEKIFSELDGELYKIFQKLRHKSAHPSGFSPSAECARFVFTEIIRGFLSKDSLLSTSRIDKLLADIPEEKFFIGYDLHDNAKIVKSEIADIHPEALTQLINRVYKKILSSTGKESSRYKLFLNSLAQIDDPKINATLLKHVVLNNISKAGHCDIFVGQISSNPQIFNHINEINALKLVENIKELTKDTSINISNTAVSNPFYCMLKIANKSDGELAVAILNAMDVFISNPKRISYFMSKVGKTGESRGKNAYLKLWELMDRELSSNEQKRVDAILEVLTLDQGESFVQMADFRAFDLISKIVFEINSSSLREGIISGGFDSMSIIKERAKKYLSDTEFNKSNRLKKLGVANYEKIKSLLS